MYHHYEYTSIYHQLSIPLRSLIKAEYLGARSPIHNHGAVCAVIKVLYGTIQSGIYNKVKYIYIN